MSVQDAESLRCSATGCVYDGCPSSGGFMCLAHWEKLPILLRQLLLSTPRYTQGWLELAKTSVRMLVQRHLAPVAPLCHRAAVRS